MSFFKVGCNFSKDLYEQASHLNKEVSMDYRTESLRVME